MQCLKGCGNKEHRLKTLVATETQEPVIYVLWKMRDEEESRINQWFLSCVMAGGWCHSLLFMKNELPNLNMQN